MTDARRGLPAAWFYGATLFSVLLLAATALNVLGAASGFAALLLGRFSLTGENNAAAWWSGMLLAVVSLHAYDARARLRQRQPGAARGWALIAAVLLFLSADEVGSIHERLAMLGRHLGLGSWSLLLPIGAVLAAMLGRALVLLWTAGGEQRRQVRLLVAGFLLLGSVALQEFIEHRIEWQSAVARAVRAVVEEGTELTGMLVLLRVAMANTAGLGGPDTAGNRVAFAALRAFRRPFMLLCLALAALLAVVTALLVDQQRGHPADWLAAVAFLAAGLVACRRLFEGGGEIGWRRWAIGALCVIASLGSVAVGPAMLVGLGPVEVGLRLLLLGALSLLVCTAWLALPEVEKRACLAAAALGAVAVLAAFWSTSLMLTYALT